MHGQAAACFSKYEVRMWKGVQVASCMKIEKVHTWQVVWCHFLVLLSNWLLVLGDGCSATPLLPQPSWWLWRFYHRWLNGAFFRWTRLGLSVSAHPIPIFHSFPSQRMNGSRLPSGRRKLQKPKTHSLHLLNFRNQNKTPYNRFSTKPILLLNITNLNLKLQKAMTNETDLCHIDDPGDPDVVGLGVR